ncbi:hypothetical protein [Agarilytica rhodophyticola]|uniref:hypothetical protein n=1 Tax=Agarilytica rhodophyticola TaxID=1737490 RepID=UPI001319D768|nr:hypothetical protein [Agarilytica rhodophyticola]
MATIFIHPTAINEKCVNQLCKATGMLAEFKSGTNYVKMIRKFRPLPTKQNINSTTKK